MAACDAQNVDPIVLGRLDFLSASQRMSSVVPFCD